MTVIESLIKRDSSYQFENSFGVFGKAYGRLFARFNCDGNVDAGCASNADSYLEHMELGLEYTA